MLKDIIFFGWPASDHIYYTHNKSTNCNYFSCNGIIAVLCVAIPFWLIKKKSQYKISLAQLISLDFIFLSFVLIRTDSRIFWSFYSNKTANIIYYFFKWQNSFKMWNANPFPYKQFQQMRLYIGSTVVHNYVWKRTLILLVSVWEILKINFLV